MKDWLEDFKNRCLVKVNPGIVTEPLEDFVLYQLIDIKSDMADSFFLETQGDIENIAYTLNDGVTRLELFDATGANLWKGDYVSFSVPANYTGREPKTQLEALAISQPTKSYIDVGQKIAELYVVIPKMVPEFEMYLYFGKRTLNKNRL
jgi:hypothetical protein